MCLLYEREITGESGDGTLEEMKDVLQTDRIMEKHGSYIEDVLRMFEENREAIDGMIGRFSRSWRLERLSRVDLSILRLALVEMLYLNDIPVKVTVNEAVEMAKKYSADKSPKFINGVLGAVIEEQNKAAGTDGTPAQGGGSSQ